VLSHPFVGGPTRKLVRSWIEREPAHQIPRNPLAKPLSACRVALVSRAGIARHDQRPFDQQLERCDPWWSDQSWPPIPRGTTEADVGIYHLHIDPRFARQDLDCVLPLRRLQELAADGIVGEAAATHAVSRHDVTVGWVKGVRLAIWATSAPTHWAASERPPPWSVPPQ
jgi:hypothetical protein